MEISDSTFRAVTGFALDSDSEDLAHCHWTSSCLCFFTQLDPSAVKKLGPTAESVYDLFNAPATEPLSLSGQRFVADVKAPAVRRESSIGRRGCSDFRPEGVVLDLFRRSHGRQECPVRRSRARAPGEKPWRSNLGNLPARCQGDRRRPPRPLGPTLHPRLSLEYSDPAQRPPGSLAQTGFITDAGLVHLGKLAASGSSTCAAYRSPTPASTPLSALSGFTCSTSIEPTFVGRAWLVGAAYPN